MNGFALAAGVLAVAGVAWGVHRRRRARTRPPAYLRLFDASRLPEAIRVVPLERRSIVVSEWLERTANALTDQGFEDAGCFTFDGARDVTIRLLAHPTHCVHAALYDHATSGRWMDIVTTYANGDQVTFTTRAGADRDPAPGHSVVQVRAVGVYAPFARACTERPMGVFKSVNGSSVANEFENAWVKWLEWKRGTSRRPAAAAA